MELDEKGLVELEGARKLLRQLPHALEQLVEDWRALLETLAPVAHDVRTALAELVAEREPLFLDEDLKAVYGPIVRVEQQAGECARLCRSCFLSNIFSSE